MSGDERSDIFHRPDFSRRFAISIRVEIPPRQFQQARIHREDDTEQRRRDSVARPLPLRTIPIRGPRIPPTTLAAINVFIPWQVIHDPAAIILRRTSQGRSSSRAARPRVISLARSFVHLLASIKRKVEPLPAKNIYYAITSALS